MALCTGALVLRAAAGLILPAELMPGAMSDRFQYQQLAVNLLDTGVYGIEPGIPDQALPPGYPIFLAAIYAFSGQTVDGIGVRLVQSFVGSMTVALTYILTRKLVPESQFVAIVATATVALHPILIFFAQIQLTETAYTFIISTGLAAIVFALDKNNKWLALCAGLSLGLTLLVREVLILFPAVVVVGLLMVRISWLQYWRTILFFCLGIVLILTPWLARNSIYQGQLSYVITGRAGYAVDKVMGDDIGSYENLEQDLDDAIQQSPLNAMRYANFRQMLSPSYAMSDLGNYLWMIGARLEYVWLHPNGLESISWASGRLVYRLAHSAVLVLAIIGLVEAWYRRRWLFWVPALLWAYSVGFHLFISTAAPRYSLPTLPLMMIFFSLGLLWVLPMDKHKKYSDSA